MTPAAFRLARNRRPSRTPAGAGRYGGGGGGKVRSDLYPASLGEADERAVGDDEMIEQAHVDQRQGPVELLGDVAVGFGRLRHAGRMVMEEHHGGGVLLQRLLHDDPRVHGRPVDGAMEEFLDLDQAMPCVEVNDAEDLVAPPGELQAQKTSMSLGAVKARPGRYRLVSTARASFTTEDFSVRESEEGARA